MFFLSDKFDMAMIYLLRSIVKNFMTIYNERSINGIAIKDMIITDSNSLNDYAENIIMKMNTDA